VIGPCVVDVVWVAVGLVVAVVVDGVRVAERR